jgi:hypothetical protein
LKTEWVACKPPSGFDSYTFRQVQESRLLAVFAFLEAAMRVSSLPGDPGYTPAMHQYQVWVAGSLRNNVVTADEGKRYALLFRRDEFGAPVLDKKTGAQVVEPYYGDVRIEFCGDEQEDEIGAIGAAIYGFCQSP